MKVFLLLAEVAWYRELWFSSERHSQDRTGGRGSTYAGPYLLRFLQIAIGNRRFYYFLEGPIWGRSLILPITLRDLSRYF